MSSSESSHKPGSYTVGLSTARFLDQALLDDVAPAVPVAPVTRPNPPAAPPTSTNSNRVESDQDVNSYMQQLLQRSGKLTSATPVAPASATPAASVSPPAAASSSQRDASPSVDPATAEKTELEEAWTTEQYMPKKTAPEREADLRAFRQLANASARGALNSFQQNVHRKQSRTSGLVALGSLAATVALFLLSSQWGDNWSLCSLGTLVLAGSSAWHFYKSGQSAQMKR